MAESTNLGLVRSKRKAISALFPHVVYRAERGGHPEIVDAFARVTNVLDSGELIWSRVKPFFATVFNEPRSPSLNQAITLASPHLPWDSEPYDERVVVRWAAAASAAPYTECVGRSVVDALLHIASVDSLGPYVPVGIWAWLKNQPSLPPDCSGRSKGSKGAVVRQVRALGDIEILKAYLLLIWSEWDCVESLELPFVRSGLAEMQISIQEDFSGVGMGRHREDLINRLDYVLEELDRGLGYLKQHKSCIDEDYIRTAKAQYEGLRRMLLEVDGEAVDTLARMSSRLTDFALLTPAETHRIPLDFRVCSASPLSIMGNSELLPSPTNHLIGNKFPMPLSSSPHTQALVRLPSRSSSLPRRAYAIRTFPKQEGVGIFFPWIMTPMGCPSAPWFRSMTIESHYFFPFLLSPTITHSMPNDEGLVYLWRSDPLGYLGPPSTIERRKVLQVLSIARPHETSSTFY